MHVHWLVLMLGLGGVAMCFGRCRRHGTPRTALTLIALASMVGGFMMFAHKSEDRRHVDRVATPRIDAAGLGDRIRDEITREVHDGLRDLDEIHDVDVRFEHEFPFADGEFNFDEKAHDRGVSAHAGTIALGAVLVICGWLLFNRNRSRPVGLKAVTVLGLAATGAILFSFIRSDSAPRVVVGHDTVVRDTNHDETASARSPYLGVEAMPQREIRRARQPIERAKRPVPRMPDELPPRAGEIPVAAELPQPPLTASADAPMPLAESQPGEPPIAATKNESADGKSDGSSKAADAAASQGESAHASADDATPADKAPVAEPSIAEPKIAEPEIEVQVAAPESPAQPADATEHSVAVTTGDALPDWANKPGKLVDTVYRVSIQSGLYADVPECQHALDDQIKAYVDDYIDRWMGDGTAALVAIDREYLNQHIKKAEYSEVVNTESVGPMHQIHALLEFDDEARSVFHERWRRTVITERVWVVGFGAAVVLALLSTVFGYLKLDLQTGGTHSGRLQLAATLVALMVAAGALLARSAVPF